MFSIASCIPCIDPACNVGRMFVPITLQSAKIISIAEPFEEIFEDLRVTVPTSCAELAFKVIIQVVLNVIVVEQCIVHIDSKHDSPESLTVYRAS